MSQETAAYKLILISWESENISCTICLTCLSVVILHLFLHSSHAAEVQRLYCNANPATPPNQLQHHNWSLSLKRFQLMVKLEPALAQITEGLWKTISSCSLLRNILYCGGSSVFIISQRASAYDYRIWNLNMLSQLVPENMWHNTRILWHENSINHLDNFYILSLIKRSLERNGLSSSASCARLFAAFLFLFLTSLPSHNFFFKKHP